ncbi:MAG: HAD family hydrolase [Thermoplasmata archaeon]
MPDESKEPRFLEPILGIVFDLDGTLVLSHHDFGKIRAAVVRAAEHHGVMPGHLSVQDPVHRIVENARESLRVSGVPDGEFWKFETEYQQAIDAIELEALPKTVVRPGAAEMLRALAKRGFRLAILTRSSEAFARAALQRTGLGEFFSYLRSRSAPGPSKPSPEALLLLLAEMEIPLERALYVGDHLLDAECATRARVRFYGILPDASETWNTGMTVDRFLSAGASAVAHDLPELSRHLGVAPTPRVA